MTTRFQAVNYVCRPKGMLISDYRNPAHTIQPISSLLMQVAMHLASLYCNKQHIHAMISTRVNFSKWSPKIHSRVRLGKMKNLFIAMVIHSGLKLKDNHKSWKMRFESLSINDSQFLVKVKQNHQNIETMIQSEEIITLQYVKLLIDFGQVFWVAELIDYIRCRLISCTTVSLPLHVHTPS